MYNNIQKEIVLPSSIYTSPQDQANRSDVYSLSESLYQNIIEKNPSSSEIYQNLQAYSLDTQLQVIALAKERFQGIPSLHMTLVKVHEMIQSNNSLNYPCHFCDHESPSIPVNALTLPQIDPTLRQGIMNYLTGNGLAKEIIIDENTCHSVLHALKVIDLELEQNHALKKSLPLSTYELRTRCLIASKGTMPSFQAYTKSIDPKYYDNPFSTSSRTYASNSNNYIPERVKVHAQVLSKYVIDSFALSRRFNNETPTVYALRGNTGVGKSYVAKTDSDIVKGVDSSGEIKGAFNPDTVKAMLRHRVDGITNQQIHLEGAELGGTIAKEIKNKALGLSIVADERANHPVISSLIETCASTNKKLVIRDIDAPLMVSMIRVLHRDEKSEPCVPFEPIASGLLSLRADRKKVIETVVDSDVVTDYQLFVTHPNGRSGLAARKLNNATENCPENFEVVDQELYDYALSLGQAEEEIQEAKSLHFNQDLYSEYQKRHKIKGNSSSDNNNYYGSKIEDFFGSSIQSSLSKKAQISPVWTQV
ncbi:MAG: hypothetical protein FJZ56_03770 [Chlamydiae bacterium]|nr:hypothetical protein [Chlamydiota bacterium]